MEKGDATHFAYLPRFADAIKTKFDLALFVESELATKNKVLRIIKTLGIMRSWKKKGYRVAYVHYSFLTAWCAKMAGITVFYWNCGEPWKYKRKKVREWFERRVYHIIDYLVTGTSGLADQYAKEYHIPRSRVKVVPNWIDLVNGNPEKSRGDLGVPLRDWKMVNGERERLRNELESSYLSEAPSASHSWRKPLLTRKSKAD